MKNQKIFSRRAFVRAVGGTVISTVGLFSIPGLRGKRIAWSAEKPSSITATAYGGPWEKAVKENFVTCFKEKTGVDANILVGTPSEWMQKIVATYQHKPAIDVLLSTSAFTHQAIVLGILEKLDENKAPNLKNVPAIFKDPFDGYAASFDGGAWAIAYNKERIKNPPDTWEELVERIIRGEFGKKVMWPSINQTVGPEFVWLMAITFGGSLDNISPGLQKIKAMKPYIAKFYSDMPSPGNALVTGEIDLAIWPDGRLWGLVKGGAKHLAFKYLKPKSPMTTVEWMKVKNSPDIAWEYLNCGFDPKAQLGFILNFPGYFVTNKEVKYPPEHTEMLDPTAADFTFKNFVFAPYKEMARLLPLWVEQWNKEIGA